MGEHETVERKEARGTSQTPLSGLRAWSHALPRPVVRIVASWCPIFTVANGMEVAPSNIVIPVFNLLQLLNFLL